jgi:hypothetical protein
VLDTGNFKCPEIPYLHITEYSRWWVSAFSGLEYWNGVLEWSAGMEYWTGVLDWSVRVSK